VSGSPIPRLITSIPAARLAATLRSSSANRYGGIRSRRLLGFMQLLDQVVGELAPEHRDRPTAQVHVEVLPNLYLELSPLEHDRNGRVPAPKHVGDRGAGGAGPAGGGLPHAALEDPRT